MIDNRIVAIISSHFWNIQNQKVKKNINIYFHSNCSFQLVNFYITLIKRIEKKRKLHGMNRNSLKIFFSFTFVKQKIQILCAAYFILIKIIIHKISRTTRKICQCQMETMNKLMLIVEKINK